MGKSGYGAGIRGSERGCERAGSQQHARIARQFRTHTIQDSYNAGLIQFRTHTIQDSCNSGLIQFSTHAGKRRRIMHLYERGEDSFTGREGARPLQVRLAILEKIDEPPRCGDADVNPPPEVSSLPYTSQPLLHTTQRFPGAGRNSLGGGRGGAVGVRHPCVLWRSLFRCVCIGGVFCVVCALDGVECLRGGSGGACWANETLRNFSGRRG